MKKRSNKKFGFTLIELLVVIVILAIVALITTPIVLDIIESATDKANLSSAYGIMETAKLYRIEKMFKDEEVPTDNILDNLKIKGTKPKGEVKVNNSGYIAIALEYGNKCYKKGFEEEDITVENYNEEEGCIIPLPPIPGFNVVKSVNEPQLTDGMTPIKWDASNNEIPTDENDNEWYDYSNKKWANVKTADGSYWVWIPRYAYKMNEGYHSSTTSSFDIRFLKGNTNIPTDNTAIETSGYNADTKNTLNNYFLHPSFQNDMNEYGFWVAKFEPSGTSSNIKIVPNVSSLLGMTISNQFIAAKSMQDKAAYGWNAANVDTHMMTNLEWGAVTYLTYSTYGKNDKIWVNPSWDAITGCAGTGPSVGSSGGCSHRYNTSNGMQASTTGNITGIYDMSGGAYEYVSAYVNNGHSSLTTNGQELINADIKYKNEYIVTTDGQENNYVANKNIYGDALWETSNCGGGKCSWNGNSSEMPYSSNPFFLRGGCGASSYVGLFDFVNTVVQYGYVSFRPIVSIIP